MALEAKRPSPIYQFYYILRSISETRSRARPTGQQTRAFQQLIRNGKRNGQCNGEGSRGRSQIVSKFGHSLHSEGREGVRMIVRRPSGVSSLVPLDIEKVTQYLAMEPNRRTMGSLPLPQPVHSNKKPKFSAQTTQIKCGRSSTQLDAVGRGVTTRARR